MGRKTFKTKITEPEVMERVNKDNLRLVEKFLKEKNIRSSDLTIENYRSDLRIFLAWDCLYNDNKHFTEIRKIEFSEFFGYAVNELQWGSARFSRMKSVLSSFSNFIEKFLDEQYPSYRSVVLKAVESMPKNAKREKTILTDEQVEMALKHFFEIGEYQIAAWLALMISCGCRFAESLRFTTDIIDVNNVVFEGLFLETTKAIKTKGRTKTGKMLKKYIVKDLFLPYYEKWLEERKIILDNFGLDHNFIFIKQNGEPAQEPTARGWADKIGNYLNIDFYPHSLRHFYTTYLASKKNSLRTDKRIGWVGKP